MAKNMSTHNSIAEKTKSFRNKKVVRGGKSAGTLYKLQGTTRRGATLGLKQNVTKLRVVHQVSQEELARLTGYSTRSVAGWEAGKVASPPAKQKLNETTRLFAALTEIVGEGGLGEWLRTPNSAFEGQTPMQVIERGESDRLWHMVFQIKGGVAT